jgi:hypothetical protein
MANEYMSFGICSRTSVVTLDTGFSFSGGAAKAMLDWIF